MRPYIITAFFEYADPFVNSVPAIQIHQLRDLSHEYIGIIPFLIDFGKLVPLLQNVSSLFDSPLQNTFLESPREGLHRPNKPLTARANDCSTSFFTASYTLSSYAT